MKLAWRNIFDVIYLIVSQKMSWTDKHYVLLLREMIVSNPLKQNTGNHERGSCRSLNATTLNSSEKPAFKVNQQAVVRSYYVKKMWDF